MFIRSAISGAVLLALLTGCGGGGDSSSSSDTRTLSVTAIDGYLKNARVWLDMGEHNYQLDKDEPWVETGEGGVGVLDVTGIDNPQQYPIIVQAIPGKTVDEDNPDEKVAAGFIMSAPAGELTVTPLSSLVEVEMNTHEALSQSEAEEKVADKLDLDPEQLLGDFTQNSEVKAMAEGLVDLGIIPRSAETMPDASLIEMESFASKVNQIQELGVLEEGKTRVVDSSGIYIEVDAASEDWGRRWNA